MNLKDAMNYARPFAEQSGAQGEKTRALVALYHFLVELKRLNPHVDFDNDTKDRVIGFEVETSDD